MCHKYLVFLISSTYFMNLIGLFFVCASLPLNSIKQYSTMAGSFLNNNSEMKSLIYLVSFTFKSVECFITTAIWLYTCISYIHHIVF